MEFHIFFFSFKDGHFYLTDNSIKKMKKRKKNFRRKRLGFVLVCLWCVTMQFIMLKANSGNWKNRKKMFVFTLDEMAMGNKMCRKLNFKIAIHKLGNG